MGGNRELDRGRRETGGRGGGAVREGSVWAEPKLGTFCISPQPNSLLTLQPYLRDDVGAWKVSLEGPDAFFRVHNDPLAFL